MYVYCVDMYIYGIYSRCLQGRMFTSGSRTLYRMRSSIP